jgi:hypothetical protein
VLLAGTVPARIRRKVHEGVRYWPRLGARVRFSCPGGAHNIDHTQAALRDPDLVVLAGGRPWLMRAHLTRPIVKRLRELSRDGVPLVGSSAGAMALCQWRLFLQPGYAPGVERGLGFAPGLAAPHYGRHGTHHAYRAFALWQPHLVILGLQDRTGLVGRDGQFAVMGLGSCTILRGPSKNHYPNGATVRLGRMASKAAPPGMAEPSFRAGVRRSA